MGIAAYNRGSKLISDQIQNDARAVEFQMMDELNALPRSGDAQVAWGPLYFTFSHGVCWAECPVSGFGYAYPSLRKAIKAWRVTITEFNNGIWVGVPA